MQNNMDSTKPDMSKYCLKSRKNITWTDADWSLTHCDLVVPQIWINIEIIFRWMSEDLTDD